MGEGVVVPFIKPKKPKRKLVRGLAREDLTEAMRGVGKPIAVVVVALGPDGQRICRMSYDDEAIDAEDVYARSAMAIEGERRLEVAEGDINFEFTG